MGRVRLLGRVRVLGRVWGEGVRVLRGYRVG